MSRPSASASTISTSFARGSSAIASRYSARSACTRGPQTAGPLLRLSIRRWIAARSAARAMSPSNTSSSRTRCPLPTPPIEGLQDICPASSARKVRRPTCPPTRRGCRCLAACVTRTNDEDVEHQRCLNASMFHVKLFAKTEAAKKRVEQVLRSRRARKAVERRPCLAQLFGDNYGVSVAQHAAAPLTPPRATQPDGD